MLKIKHDMRTKFCQAPLKKLEINENVSIDGATPIGGESGEFGTGAGVDDRGFGCGEAGTGPAGAGCD